MKNLTLGLVKVYQTVLETLEALKIKSVSYHLKLSIWFGFTTGPEKALGAAIMRKWNSPNTEINGINWQGIKRESKNTKTLTDRSQTFIGYKPLNGEQPERWPRSNHLELFSKRAFLQWGSNSVLKSLNNLGEWVHFK